MGIFCLLTSWSLAIRFGIYSWYDTDCIPSQSIGSIPVDWIGVPRSFLHFKDTCVEKEHKFLCWPYEHKSCFLTHSRVKWFNTNLCRIRIKYVVFNLFLYTLICFYIHLFTHERIYILAFNHNMHNCQCNY